jgi:hypothetical protein
MKRLQRFSPYDAAKVLRDGIEKGLWTLEDLDNPPPGTRLSFAEYRRFLSDQRFVGQEPVYKNLLRELEENKEDEYIL